uniref:ABC transporter substrate-binding protein n=1 Tax=Caldivirga sp. TaxID=2080243 RepID=UPI0025C37860
MPKLNVSRILAVATIVVAVTILYASMMVHAQQKPQFIVPIWGSLMYVPGTPIWNVYAPGNQIWWTTSFPPLAYWSVFTYQPYPILAENWTVQVLPNGSGILTIYIRPGFYWFNGTVILAPFTAWDVYAYFYIGMKAFGWYVPDINQSLVDEDIKVLNNYTIQFLFQKWSPFIPYWVMTSWVPTPYPVWRWAVEALKTMNTTQAMLFGQNNVTRFVAPYWGLGPYVMTSVGTNFVNNMLEPLYFDGKPLLATWLKVLPWATWNYYDPLMTVKFVPGGSSVGMAMIESGEARGYFGGTGFSWQQMLVLNKTPGIGLYFYPGFVDEGITLNPYVYPLNIPAVRQALCDAINFTQVALAWVPSIPKPYPEPVTPNIISTFPKSVAKYYIPCEFNLTKAAELLKSAGLTYKNGQWYLPNGTQLTLTITAPSAWTSFVTQGQVVAEEWSAFGIPTKLLSMDLSTWFGTIYPHGEFEGGMVQGPAYIPHSYLTAWTYLSSQFWVTEVFNLSRAWPFAWPVISNGKVVGWSCSPVTVTVPSMYNSTPPYLNGTIVTCVNSTFGYINLTNWFSTYDVSTPGSKLYEELTKVLFAWYYYYVPIVPMVYGPYGGPYAKAYFDPYWIIDCIGKYSATAFYTIMDAHENGGQWMVWAGTPREYLDLGVMAPPPDVPPLAQLIANGSLWTEYPQFASYLGLTPEFTPPANITALQQCVASYFHI